MVKKDKNLEEWEKVDKAYSKAYEEMLDYTDNALSK